MALLLMLAFSHSVSLTRLQPFHSYQICIWVEVVAAVYLSWGRLLGGFCNVKDGHMSQLFPKNVSLRNRSVQRLPRKITAALFIEKWK